MPVNSSHGRRAENPGGQSEGGALKHGKLHTSPIRAPLNTRRKRLDFREHLDRRHTVKTRNNGMLKVLGVLAVTMFAFGLAQEAGLGVNLAESSEHGQYLVDQEGMALYMFAPDAQ